MTRPSSTRTPLPALLGLLGGAVLAVGILDAGPGKASPLPLPPIPSGGVDEEGGEAPIRSDPLRILQEETVLAVVIQTTGIASRFAPDHLIHASRYDLTLHLDPHEPEEARFSGQIPVAHLVVDEGGLRDELQGRLLELGVLDDPYDEISEEDRERIRSSMLDEDQLDAAEHPLIEVEVVEIRPSGEDAFPWTVTGALTVRGVRAEAPLRARMEEEGDGVRIESWGAFRFSDLGIEPYSAFLGAVRNRDEFHLYMSLVAEPAGGA